MKIHKIYIVVGMIIALALFLEIAAHADDVLQATEITFNQLIQIPGQILPAGPIYSSKLAATTRTLCRFQFGQGPPLWDPRDNSNRES
jgi:hypothetical protein